MSLFLTVITGLFILIYGKLDSFVLINSNHNKFWDFVFTWFTHFGDGFIWVPLAVYCIFRRRKFLLTLVTGSVISTFITQFLKRVIFTEELRPISLLSNNFPIHTIDGIFINNIHSFPSGHTATAFTMALLLAYMLDKKWWSVFLPLIAFGVGYSRVYQAQHFVTDILGGMIIGIISAYLSILIHKYFRDRKKGAEYKFENSSI